MEGAVRGLGLLLQLVLVAVLTSPSLAWACPTCATREPNRLGMLAAVAAMIAAPFVIVLVAVRAIRKLERQG